MRYCKYLAVREELCRFAATGDSSSCDAEVAGDGTEAEE